MPLGDRFLEFFKTNTHQSVRIAMHSPKILDIVNSLDGHRTLEQLIQEHGVSTESLQRLLCFLEKNAILDHVEPHEDFECYADFRRVIHFLADFSMSHAHLLEMWRNIRQSKILLIGLGAVGSLVACNLVQSGVERLVLMDGDVVGMSNLHRQFGYTENQLGRLKSDALEEKLHSYNPHVEIIKINKFLEESTLYTLQYKVDLVINCADQPNVDTTSLWVGKYCMDYAIPHIIGEG